MDGTTALVELGLGSRATASEISRAFRELAKRTHPDHQGSAAAFRRLRLARDVALDHAAPEPMAPGLAVALGSADTRFDRYDIAPRPRRRPVSPPHRSGRPEPADRTDHNGLLFADHLAQALAS